MATKDSEMQKTESVKREDKNKKSLKKKQKKLLFIMLGSIVWLVAMGIFLLGYRHYQQSRPWYERYRTVTHALGVTPEGERGTNSLEAFLYNYEQGQRVFEADIQIASDDVMVLRHDWTEDYGQAEVFGWTEEDKEIPTSEEFLAAPIYGKYTPLTLEEWFCLMQEYSDIYMITDTKYSMEVTEQFQLLVDTAVNAGCKDVLERVIVQVYFENMYYEVMHVYPFENLIYTIYYAGYHGPEATAGFCAEKGIPVLVMPKSKWDEEKRAELSPYDVNIYVHTVNEVHAAKDLIDAGVYGVYTDELVEQDVY